MQSRRSHRSSTNGAGVISCHGLPLCVARPRAQVFGEAAKLIAILLRQVCRLAGEMSDIHWQARRRLILASEIGDWLPIELG